MIEEDFTPENLLLLLPLFLSLNKSIVYLLKLAFSPPLLDSEHDLFWRLGRLLVLLQQELRNRC